MSQYYGIDNDGDGFAFDSDDNAMENLFNQTASSGDFDDDDDNSHLQYFTESNDNEGSDEYVSESNDNVNDNVNDNSVYVSQEQDYVAESDVQEETYDDSNYQEPSANYVSSANDHTAEEYEDPISDNVPRYDETTQDTVSDTYENYEEFTVESSPVAQSPYEDNTQEYTQNSVASASEEEFVPAVYNSSASVAPNANSPYVTSAAPQESAVSQERYVVKDSSAASGSVVYSATEPIQETQDTRSRQRINIMTEEEEIQKTAKIIKVLDVYRKLSQKDVVAQLIYNQNDVDPADEASLVVKVLNTQPIYYEMMTSFREAATQKDRVERVFYILRLDRDILDHLGGFLETLSEVEFVDKHDQISYSKQLEHAIDNLDNKVVQLVADAQSVLSAANE